MSLKRKKMLLRQKEYFEQKLKDRQSLLSKKKIEPAKADKDSIVRKLQADVRAVNSRLRKIAADEKLSEELAKIKADRLAAPKKEEEGKAEKPKKALEEGKGKKEKPERKAGAAKAPEGAKPQKPAEAPEGGKAKAEKKTE